MQWATCARATCGNPFCRASGWSASIIHHADINKRRREQIRDRDRVECHGNAFGDAIGTHQFVADFAAGVQYSAAYLVAQVGSEQTGVERRQCFAFGFKYVPQAHFQRIDRWPALTLKLRLVTVIVDLHNRLRTRLRGDANDIARLYQAGHAGLDGAFE